MFDAEYSSSCFFTFSNSVLIVVCKISYKYTKCFRIKQASGKAFAFYFFVCLSVLRMLRQFGFEVHLADFALREEDGPGGVVLDQRRVVR